MNVYILDADVNDYRGLVYEDEDIVEFNRRFDGRSLKEGWTGKERFGFVCPRLPKGDTPGLSSHIPVFNPKAVKALADFVEPSGELLPVTCGGERFFLFNVTRLVDALDETNSDLKRFSDGRIMMIDRHVFQPEKLRSVVVFKLPQKPLSCAYVTDPFVQRVNDAGLKGFKFPLVWSSD
jgi:hypothetical protein